MIDFDFNDDLNAKPVRMTPAEVRKQAHIANGGEASFPCPKCRGTGQTPWGRCFKCGGNGSVSRGVIAAAKGKITKEANRQQWLADNAAAIEFLRKRSERWDFARSMLEKIEEWGKLTENQMAVIVRAMAKDAERAKTFQAEREAKSGDVGLEAIAKLFATAKSNGLKKPVWHAAGMVIQTDRQFGCNDLWVKSDEGQWLGKIINGRFNAFRSSTALTLSTLREIAENPIAAAVKFNRATNRCCCCGQRLEAGVSVVSGVGPICAGKWGLEHLRDAARDELSGE